MPNLRKVEDFSESLSFVHNYSICPYTREIYLHSHYGGEEEPGVEYRMATTFIKNLHFLERQSNKDILVHMHTVGGEWADGMAVYDAISISKCPITIIVHAHASSMSGIILQAAKKRYMMPNADFLIHYGSVSLDSDSIAAKSMIDWNDSLHRRMLKILSGRAVDGIMFKGWDREEVEEFMDSEIIKRGDWIFNAETAVEMGLCDGIKR